MSAQARLDASGLLGRAQDFLYREAELADGHRYDEWKVRGASPRVRLQ